MHKGKRHSKVHVFTTGGTVFIDLAPVWAKSPYMLTSRRSATEINLFGTPEAVVDRITMLREDFSTDEIMFEVNWTASVPREVVMTTMRLLTDKVIPSFK